MISFLKRLTGRDVLLISILALLLSVFFLEYPILSQTGGTLAYPLDNSYAPMAIAKNLVLHGTWGFSADHFVAASSSILYPILLALFFKVFGVHLLIPLLINLAAAILFLVVLQKWMSRRQAGPGIQLLILLSVVFLIPLPVVVAIGMEHCLQILFSFLFLYQFSEAQAG